MVVRKDRSEAFIIPLDSRKAQQVPTEQSLWSQMELTSDEETAQLRERLEPYLELIPEIEHKIIDAYFRGLTEREIAEHYECSQAAVSYRLGRAVQRLKWWVSRPEKPEGFRTELDRVMRTPREAIAVEVFADAASFAWALERVHLATKSASTIRNWVNRAMTLVTPEAAAYMAYSLKGLGLVYEARTRDESRYVGSLSRNTKGKR